jgi:prepilin-type N-terminal cleavage/methylation domain-containing protein
LRDDVSTKMKLRAYTLVELLVSLAIVLILTVAVGDTIVTALRLQAMHADRVAMSRSASELAARLGEEARSSTAVFIPTTDINGNPNSGSSGSHEVDFFRKLSAGGQAFAAYDFDGSRGEVTRYEYSSMTYPKSISAQDLVASGISSFSVMREPVANAGPIVGQSDPASVTILYGNPELVGGNDVIVADIMAQASSGIPGHLYVVHLASRAAPTSLAILAPKAPPVTPPTTHVFPFVILRAGVPLTPPHGPMQPGEPGAPSVLLHATAASGTIEFAEGIGSGSINWFEFSTLYASVESGTYTLKLPDGSSASVSIACAGGPCPPFRPSPVNAPQYAPEGGVVFQLASR